ncbi:MAG: glycosyltransferase family 4 protein [Chloroflexota bacterium]|nr:glycosyltransferase family 4 protein [Chloroflexota bacterium]
MHIAQIAPPWFSVPPPAYGGIERVVHDLTEGFVANGHRVTLFAPGDSKTRAELVPTVPRGIGLDGTPGERADVFARTSRDAYAEAERLGADIIHDHTDFVPEKGSGRPVVRTLHGPAVEDAVLRYVEMSRRGDWLVAISQRQRILFEEAAERLLGNEGRLNFGGMIHNPTHLLDTPFYPAGTKQGYAAFLGRCHWEKDPAAAIRIAIAAGVHLKMALRVTKEEHPFFEACVAPLLPAAGELVEFVGETSGPAKDELMGRASVVIFPSPWEEPFGLVLTEAAARGTPVVAYRRGSAPEIVVDGVTGILCDDEAGMVAAIPRAMGLDPAACRAHAEATFARPVIARQYADLYAEILADREARESVPGQSFVQTGGEDGTGAENWA